MVLPPPSRGDGGPLAGFRVLEIGHMLAGPFAAMLLADLGAEVVKIEHGEGDISRRVGQAGKSGHGAYFASLNRNKKSVCVDLTTPAGQCRLGELVAGSHALIVNLKASTIQKLGLTYDALSRYNQRLVCVGLTGFGLEGPASDWPAFDYIIQAMTGVAAMTGDPHGPPVLAGYSVVDNSAGIMAALAVVAKILSGEGGQMEVSLFDAQLAQLNYHASAWLNDGESPQRFTGSAHRFFVPAQVFPTAEGHLAIFVTHDEFWRSLAEELGHPEWVRDPRMATMAARADNRSLVLAAVEHALLGRTAEDWTERLRRRGIPIASVQALPDALLGDIVATRQMVVTVPTPSGDLRFVGNPIRDTANPRSTYRPPPLLGEHDPELLGSEEAR